jgi:hypothetical protein
MAVCGGRSSQIVMQSKVMDWLAAQEKKSA